MKKILLIICMFFCFSLSVNAEDTDIYKEQYEISGANELDETLPDETRKFFNENDIDTSDYNWVNKLTGQNVFSHIWEFVRSGAKIPLRVGAGILGVVLVTAALSAASERNSVMTAAIYASTLAAAAVLAGPVYSSVSAASNAIKGSGTFMLSFIPVFASIVAASGGAFTSVSMSALLLGCAEGVTYIASFAVLPLMGGYLAMSICTSVSPLVDRSGIADGIRKLSVWIMSLVSTVFVGILSIQTAVNSAADSLTIKTTKFILGTSVPIAGTALSEAVSTVTASMSLLKSSVGIYGVVAVAIIFIPIIIELTLWRGVLLVTASISELFSLSKISGLLKAVDMMISLLLGVLLLTAAMFIISLTVVVSCGKAA